MGGTPPLLRFLRWTGQPCNFSRSFYQGSVLLLTFMAYTLYHLSRKPPSIVKGALHPQTNALPDGQCKAGGWAPFNTEGGKGLLGDTDFAFLGSYAIGMYYAGHLGDRINLRYFLATGMIISGTFVCLFGMAYFLNIHSIYYFLFVQVVGGLFQATGWPSVVTVMANWFGKGQRGLIMGIWNAHTSCGNILGSAIAAEALRWCWGWSFLIPGMLIITGGVIVFLCLPVDPEDVGLESPYSDDLVKESDIGDLDKATQSQSQSPQLPSGGALLAPGEDATFPLSSSAQQDWPAHEPLLTVAIPMPVEEEHRHGISFLTALFIPGVIDFALCLFFTKLVAYTFLMWLPYYIQNTPIHGVKIDKSLAGGLSTLFDIGGILGGVLSGHLSDRYNAPATTSALFMIGAIPGIYVYRHFGKISMFWTCVLMSLAGALINGPYALITTAVSADLGTHSSIKGDARALATVTAIIDGTGSIGAAMGPFLTGMLDWRDAFLMLMFSALMAALMLSKAVIREVNGQTDGPHDFQHRTPRASPMSTPATTPRNGGAYRSPENASPEDSPRLMLPAIEPGYCRI